MIRPPLRALALAIGLLPCLAAATDDVPLVENDEKRGLVKSVVEPRWPRGARDLEGYVDIVATLTPTLWLKDAVLTPDREESAVFVAPLRDVLRRWKFNAQTEADCSPRRGAIRLRVLFQDGRVRVLHSPESMTLPPQPVDATMRTTHREEPRFPLDMLRRGIGAVVYSRAEVAPDGHVTAVRVRAFSSMATGDSLLPFEVEVTRALKKWTYTPAAEGVDRPRTACWTINFNIYDDD